MRVAASVSTGVALRGKRDPFEQLSNRKASLDIPLRCSMESRPTRFLPLRSPDQRTGISHSRCERGAQFSLEICRIFQTHGESDEAVTDATGAAFVGRHELVRRTGGVG